MLQWKQHNTWRPKIFRYSKVLILCVSTLILFAAGEPVRAQSAGNGNGMDRGSIPEALVRPHRGEGVRYPIDTVIGPLGQGEAPREGYLFARQVAAALSAGNRGAASLAAMNQAALEQHLSALGAISPRTYRLGSGREEADGAVSFLVRFVGRAQGISGELYIRLVYRPASETGAPAGRVWTFEDLILDEARSRESEDTENKHRFDFSPYERFF